MSGPYYLGVDAGNSKTVALVGDAAGRVIGHGRSGNGDIYGAKSPESAVAAVLSAVRTALAQAGVERVASAAFRLAGVDWPEDEAFWDERLKQLPELASYSIRNDGFAPIRCVEPSGVGVGIVSGTGPAVAARGVHGREWSMSFWAQDALGAGGLVHQALRAVYLGHIGLGPATVLTDQLLAHFQRPDVEAMLHSFTGREESGPHRPVADAAPLVTAAAGAGDAVAQDIVRRQAERFADYGWAAARAVGFDVDSDPVPVALAGSVLSGAPMQMVATLRAALLRRIPHARVQTAELPPVAGALLDAMAEAGAPITAGLVHELTTSVAAAEKPAAIGR